MPESKKKIPKILKIILYGFLCLFVTGLVGVVIFISILAPSYWQEYQTAKRLSEQLQPAAEFIVNHDIHLFRAEDEVFCKTLSYNHKQNFVSRDCDVEGQPFTKESEKDHDQLSELLSGSSVDFVSRNNWSESGGKFNLIFSTDYLDNWLIYYPSHDSETGESTNRGRSRIIVIDKDWYYLTKDWKYYVLQSF